MSAVEGDAGRRVARAAAPAERFAIGLGSPSWPMGSAPNGVLTYVATLSAQLQARGHPVSILAGAVDPGEHALPVYDSWGGWATRPWTARLRYAARFRLAPHGALRERWRWVAGVAARMVAEQGLRVLEVEEAHGTAYWIQRAVPVPVVVRLHGPWFLNGAALGEPEDGAFHWRIEEERRAIEAASGVSAPSQNVLDEVRRRYGLGLPDAVVIPNPAPPVPPEERWQLAACEPGRILFVGRFDRHKGGDLMLDAFARVWRARPDARLSFAGPDRGVRGEEGRRWTLEAYLRARLPDALAAGAVELLGPLPFDALGALRRRALVSVVCSRYENFPGTLVEALSRGCPVVAADVGGIPELVQDDVNGLLHRPGDADHLAARLLELLDDPGRAARLGAAGLRSCERLQPAAVAAQVVAHYTAVLGG
jgi:glycosyltransferase involved in cell wall biosynthesis